MKPKKKPLSPEGQSADLSESVEFKNFEEATKRILKVPKSEVEKRLAKERSSIPRRGPQNNEPR